DGAAAELHAVRRRRVECRMGDRVRDRPRSRAQGHTVNATEMRARPHTPTKRKTAFLGSSKAALFIWCAIIGVSALWGWALLRRGANFSSLDAPPLTGHFRPHLSAGLILPVALVAVGVWLLPRAAARARWRTVVLFAS